MASEQGSSMETMMDNDEVATLFILRGIQEWGQSQEDRIEAVQRVITAAGFDATVNGSIVFGGIIAKPLTGADADGATTWLKTLLETMQRGRVQDEIAHVHRAIEERQTAKAQS